MQRGIDLEFGKKQITASVTSGILMGSSTSRIAADLRERIVGMSVDSALRAARTAVTAAENGGRQSSYERAAEMGIEMTREWLATRDARTRHAHGMADGQRVAVDEPFIVGGEELMFPGDTSHGASGWNVYNCRCTLLSWIKGHERKRETYPEWLEKKFEEDPEGTALEFKKVARASADKKQWQEYRTIVGNAVPRSLDKFQDLKYTDSENWKSIKTLKTQTEVVNNAPCVTTPRKFSEYLLKPGAKHANEFFNVGYTENDVLQLRYDISRQFDIEKAVEYREKSDGAQTFNIYMKLGITKKRSFVVSWIEDRPGEKPRIVTAFRKDRDERL